MKKIVFASFAVLLILQLFYTIFYWQHKNEFIYFFPIIGFYSLLHFWIYKRQTIQKKHILLLSIPFHFIFVFTSPFLSDDIYRYIWDGLVSSNGSNPYLFAPQNYPSELLKNVYTNFTYINHPQYSTLYLPIPELIFFFSALLSPTLFTIKIITFFFFLISTYFISKIDHFYNLKNKLLFMFTLHPLIIYEISSSSHLDSFYLTFVICAYYYTQIKRSLLSNVFWSLSAFTRPLSVFYTLYLKEKRVLSILLIVPLIAFYIYLSHIPDSGLNAYSSQWHFNHIFFENFRHLFLEFYNDIESVLSYKLFLKIISTVCIFIFIFFLRNKITSFEEFILISHLSLTFLSATIYPWYLIVILPFAIIKKQDSLIIFLYTVLLSYWVLIDYFSNKIWSESLFIIAFEYGIPVLYFYLKEIKSTKNIPKIKTS